MSAIIGDTGISMLINDFVRKVPNFPRPGITFRDITPLLAAPSGLWAVTRYFLESDRYNTDAIDVIAAIESRGFIFGAAISVFTGCGLALIRKAGKLPAETFSYSYTTEYSTDTVEIHKDSIKPGQRVVIIDDLLATGGTVAAAAHLVEMAGAHVVECGFVIELEGLGGRALLEKQNYQVHSACVLGTED